MRFAIALDAALRLFREWIEVPGQHSVVAPTLLRSQALSHLYASVLRGEIDRQNAASQLDHMRLLKIRLLGDRVLQKVAWEIAERLQWKDTLWPNMSRLRSYRQMLSLHWTMISLVP